MKKPLVYRGCNFLVSEIVLVKSTFRVMNMLRDVFGIERVYDLVVKEHKILCSKKNKFEKRPIYNACRSKPVKLADTSWTRKVHYQTLKRSDEL